jgi:peptide/nickel transport system substrate-binding protein
MTRYPSQLHYFPFSETDYLRLNTTQPPFNDVRVRKALNFAIDRAALVRMWGPAIAKPTCQVLPPSFLGYQRYCPYARGGSRAEVRGAAADLEQARRLVTASGTQGEQITVWGTSDSGVEGNPVVTYIVRVLRQLGYHARARLEPSSYIVDHPQLGKTIQLIPEGLANGRTGDFFNHACSAFATSNYRWFCDAQLERTIQAAAALEARNPRAAAVRWAGIDREFVDRAAWVPMVNVRWVDFVSARIHDYEADPTVGFIADQASLR